MMPESQNIVLPTVFSIDVSLSAKAMDENSQRMAVVLPLIAGPKKTILIPTVWLP
jgi:hypothetical protein